MAREYALRHNELAGISCAIRSRVRGRIEGDPGAVLAHSPKRGLSTSEIGAALLGITDSAVRYAIRKAGDIE